MCREKEGTTNQVACLVARRVVEIPLRVMELLHNAVGFLALNYWKVRLHVWWPDSDAPRCLPKTPGHVRVSQHLVLGSYDALRRPCSLHAYRDRAAAGGNSIHSR